MVNQSKNVEMCKGLIHQIARNVKRFTTSLFRIQSLLLRNSSFRERLAMLNAGACKPCFLNNAYI